MTTNPFQLEGEWLRAQLHCHSTNSDGELTPDALASRRPSVTSDRPCEHSPVCGLKTGR